MTLLKLKFKLIREQLKAADVVDTAAIASIDTALASIDSVHETQVRNAAMVHDNTLQQIKLETKERKKGYLDAASGRGGSLQELLSLGSDTITKEDGTTSSGLDFLMDEGTMRQKVDFAKGLTAEFVETLKTLGPNGEFVAAVTQGAFAITDAFVLMSEQMKVAKNAQEKSAAKYGMIASAIGAINSMMQAGYQRNIASIDAQIAAEKKRDGQSAASVAKIQAMEKKKEQQQRKAFEMNKKMLIAQTIMNTAAAYVATLGTMGFFGIPLAHIVLALGAAQVAMIASQSFQGGGSSVGGGGTPSKVSMGERRNTVDLAKSQSARGELAYFRGDAGTGGPENFKPAFGGYKNRAEGGNTAFMVGEQGPELFVPGRAGAIVPNDDIAAGAPTNVSFNINTIDASGVEDMLTNQRGNIIGMIRQAANSYGESFVESVDTSVFTPTQLGAVERY